MDGKFLIYSQRLLTDFSGVSCVDGSVKSLLFDTIVLTLEQRLYISGPGRLATKPIKYGKGRERQCQGATRRLSGDFHGNIISDLVRCSSLLRLNAPRGALL
jgi:hypothetical protein